MKNSVLPGFWIKNMQLSGVTGEGIVLSGSITNIVSKQDFIGQPTHIDLQGVSEDNALVRLYGVMDHRNGQINESFRLDIENIPLNDVKLTDFHLFHNIESGTGDIGSTLNFSNSGFQADVEFIGKNIAFDYLTKPESMDQDLYSVSVDIAKDINEIEVFAGLEQLSNSFNFKVASNLDNIVTEKIREILSEELEKGQRYLREQIDQEIQPYKLEYDRFLEERDNGLVSEISTMETENNRLQAMVEKKREKIKSRLQDEKEKTQKKIEKEGAEKILDLL